MKISAVTFPVWFPVVVPTCGSLQADGVKVTLTDTKQNHK